MSRAIARHGPLAAIGFAVLGFVATGLTVPDAPDFNDPGAEVLQYYDDKHGRVQAGGYLYAVAGLFYLWFLGGLRAAMAAAERGTNRLTGIAYGAGVASAALLWASNAPSLAAALRAEDNQLTPDVAATLWDLGNWLYVMALFPIAVLLVASGLLALQTGVLPRWLGLLAFPLAVALITPVGQFAFVLYVLWTVAAGVSLYSAAGARPPAAPDRP